MHTNIVDTKTSIFYQYYTIRNIELLAPLLINDEKTLQDFAFISLHFNCAIFGEDFNSVFIIGSPKQEIYNLRLAFLEGFATEITNTTLFELLDCIYEKYCDVQIFKNKKGIYITEMCIENKNCILTIDTQVYSNIKDVISSTSTSQEMCLYKGDLCMSNRCIETLATGIAYINLDNYHRYFENDMFNEFCKGFSFKIPDMYIDVGSLKYNMDIVERFILSMPKHNILKMELCKIICFNSLALIPHDINSNYMDCMISSWYDYDERPSTHFLRQNTRILTSGDADDFYISLRYRNCEWSTHLKYELKNTRMSEIEAVMMFFPQSFNINEIIEEQCRKLQIIERDRNSEMQFNPYVAGSGGISLEKWLKSYYVYAL